MPAFLLSVLVPILTDMFKSAAPAVSRKFFGESVDDTIKLGQLDIERVSALAKLDNPYGVVSTWVADLRGSFRYLAAAALIFSGIFVVIYGTVYSSPEIISTGIELVSGPFGFIFGERLVLSFKGSPR